MGPTVATVSRLVLSAQSSNEPKMGKWGTPVFGYNKNISVARNHLTIPFLQREVTKFKSLEMSNQTVYFVTGTTQASSRPTSEACFER